MKESGGELPRPTPAALSMGPPVRLVDILLLFARIGLTSFGGGLSAWIYREVVVRRQWLTEGDFLSGMTLAQIMPGTNVVNVSIYIGHRLRGAAGSAVAVASLLLPPMAVIVILAAIIHRYGDLAWLHDLLEGIAAGAIGMTLSVVLRAARHATSKNRLAPAVLLAVFGLVGLLGWPMIPVVIVVGSISVALVWRKG
jgi:chromate transporter